MKNKKFLSKMTMGILTISVGAATFAGPVDGIDAVAEAGQVATYGEEVGADEEVVQEAEPEVTQNVEENNEEIVKMEVDAEPATTVTDKIKASQVVVANNVAGTPDTIVVNDLESGTEIKVYATSEGTSAIGTAKVATGSTSVTISVAQLGAAAGTIYVTATEEGKNESERVAVDYTVEPTSKTLTASQVKPENNANAKDKVVVSDLTKGDIVKVYNADCTKVIGVEKAGEDGTATVIIAQIGEEATSIQVSLTEAGKLEGAKLIVKVNAEEQAAAIDAKNVKVLNNVTGTKDQIEVTGLAEGTVVTVYEDEKNDKVLGTATAAVKDEEVIATVILNQLGVDAGKVYITTTEANKKESDRVAVAFDAEPVSEALKAEQVKVINNAGAKDTVDVTGLNKEDVVKVYNADGTKVLGTAIAKEDGKVTISIAQIGTEGATIQVSVTTSKHLESKKLTVEVAAEATTAALDAEAVEVENNATGIKDTVTVKGLKEGTILKVYAKKDDTRALGTAVAKDNMATVVTVAQLDVKAGNVYVTVTEPNQKESDKTEIAYNAEPVSATLKAEQVEVKNNAGAKDTVEVTGLKANDVVKVYNADETKVLGTATVKDETGKVTISIAQLGEEATAIKVSVTSKANLESEKLDVEVAAEVKTTALDAKAIAVENNATGIKDTVTVKGLKGGTILKVYGKKDDLKALGTAVAKENMDTVVTLAQLDVKAGSVYVTVTEPNQKESDKTEVTYAAEPVSTALKEEQVEVSNNAGAKDTVKVTGIKANDVVKVYNSDATKVLGTMVAKADGEVTVSIAQLGTEGATIQVSVTTPKNLESEKLTVEVAAEATTTALDAKAVAVENNATGIKDIVTVKGLKEGTILKVYGKKDDLKALGTAVAKENMDTVVTLAQLDVKAGNVYVTVTEPNQKESDKTEVAYAAEPVSTALKKEQVEVSNNAGTKDTVKVTGIKANDVVKVYNSDATKVLGTMVAKADGEVTVSIAQLGTEGATIQVSVTTPKNLESEKLTVEVAAEATTTALDAKAVAVENNATGIKDIVTVKGLKEGTILKVYGKKDDLKALGTAVAKENMDTVVTVAQLDVKAGNVYVTVTEPNQKESDKTEVAYAAEPVSETLKEEQVTVNNNATAADTVEVTGLAEGDTVIVYNGTKDKVLGKAVVKAGATSATISIPQLGEVAGNIYVTNTKKANLESDYLEVSYKAEEKSGKVDAKKIVIINNLGTDVIFVYGLSAGTVVKVYDAESEGNVIAKATVAANQSEAYMTVKQLDAAGGKVYISLTEAGQLEGDRVAVDFSAEK